MKEKLSRIRSPLRRLILSLVIAGLAALSVIKSPRAQIHWIGTYGRPRRRERMLLMFLMLISAFVLETHHYVMWAAVWGGIASLYIILHSLLIMARSTSTSGDWLNGDDDR